MITRNQARKALAELQQPTQIATPVKPFQSTEGVANMAKKMQIISLNSDSEQHDGTRFEEGVVVVSESSESIMDTLSSDEIDGDESDVSEDEDGDDSEDEGMYQHVTGKPSSSSLAGELLAEEVISQIKGDDLKKLKVDNCRSYLRHYGLRVTGTKPVLIDRIKQHIELKEGGCKNYERPTFTINCTGDVCKGDVVMFDQMVYEKYDVLSQSAAAVGRRTVAGRVVKESYGAQRQQHTFTVEVLWSTGCRPLAPMKQLLVKGRNLYKRRTFRQRWSDEGERRRSLDEKHERGAAARHVRATKHGRLKGYTGTIRLEVQQLKQLANPYTNTLASKKNCNYAHQPISESAIALRPAVGVTSQDLSVHSHSSLAPQDKPEKTQDFSASSNGGCTFPNIHRQWFKPLPPLISGDSLKQERCTSPIRPSFESKPLQISGDSHKQQSCASPVRPSLESRPWLISGDPNRQQRCASPVRPSFESRPWVISGDSHKQQSCASPTRSSLKSRWGPPLISGDSHKQHICTSSMRPSFEPRPPLISGDSDKQQRCVSLLRPSFETRPLLISGDFHKQQRYASPIRPSFEPRPPLIYGDSHNQQRCASPIRLSFESRPPLISGDSHKQLRCASPVRSSLESRPWVISGDPNKQQRCASPPPMRPSSELGSQSLHTGFPCPTTVCANRGSKWCSSGLCYYCCKKKGGPCRYPNHRPELSMSCFP